MGSGLRIEVVNRETNAREVGGVYHDFPVRIGRDALNEIELHSTFVSKFHATLELRDNSVFLRDLGSRNGTAVGSPTQNVAAHERVDLREHGFTFMIGALHFTTEIVDVARAPEERDRGGAMLSSNPGGPPVTARVAGASVLAVSTEARLLADDLRAPYDGYRTAWNRFYEKLAERLQSMQPETRKQVVRLLANDFPATFAEPDFQKLAKHFGIALTELRPTGAQPEEAALEVLQELATWYSLPHPLTSTADVIRFAQKIQDALDALFDAYVRLRGGLRKFESEFEVDHSAKPNGPPRTSLDTARNNVEVGMRMLDWNDPTNTARAMRNVVADLLIHDMGLINGVMKGAGALLAELSPRAIHDSLTSAKQAGRAGFAWGPYRFRELWRHFERRHKDVASEEKDTFARLFGREFADAYQQLVAVVVPEDEEAPQRRRGSTTARPPADGAPATNVAAAGAKTPETHGLPKTQGPTGTVIVPRTTAPRPNAGPLTERADNADVPRPCRRDERSSR